MSRSLFFVVKPYIFLNCMRMSFSCHFKVVLKLLSDPKKHADPDLVQYKRFPGLRHIFFPQLKSPTKVLW